MERIVFLDRKSVNANFRAPNFAHEWQDYAMTYKDEVVERLQGATIAITNKVALRQAEIEQLPALRLIAVAATGTDCVDVKYCREHDITVVNVRNYALHSVPEHVLTLMLALRRNLMAYARDVRAGAWEKSDIFCLLDHPIHELANSTFGLIGYGAIGQAVEKLVRAFGMKVMVAEHKGSREVRAGRMAFEEVLNSADVISLHCPLTAETRELLGAAEFSRMKKSALLINCGRGGLIDETALVNALTVGEIAGAGLDVLTKEPPRDGSSLLNLQLPNLIITPHIAWASLEAMQTLADQLVENLEAFIQLRIKNQ